MSVFEIGMKFTILQLKLLGPSIYLAVGCEASGSEAKQFYHHQSDNLGNGGPQATTNLGSSILLKQDIFVVCGMWYYGVVKVIFLSSCYVSILMNPFEFWDKLFARVLESLLGPLIQGYAAPISCVDLVEI